MNKDAKTAKILPDWIRKDMTHDHSVMELKKELRRCSVHTVCEEAKCPNLSECFGKKRTATFMILGDRCTRSCAFCNVRHDDPLPVDDSEPQRIAGMVKLLGLEHTVITSVTRDDLKDGGALQFARTIWEIRKQTGSTVEVLTPDFNGIERDRKTVSEAAPDIFNHNVETVSELYYKIRPQADYKRSLEFLKGIKSDNKNVLSKSGIMAGLGETDDQLKRLLHDLSGTGLDIFTCGQYLRPSRNNIPVTEYPDPEWFDRFSELARSFGIKYVFASPFTRSSYNAAEVMQMIRKDRVHA